MLSLLSFFHFLASALPIEGYGGETQSLGGIGVLGHKGPTATFHNPALLSLDPLKGNFLYTLSLQKNAFNSIEGVIVQNTYTGGDVARGSVDVSGPYKLVHTLAGRFMLAPTWKRLTLGVLAQIPDTGLTQIDTGGFLQPRYIRHADEGHIPELHASVSVLIFEGFSLGLGSSFGAKVKGFTDLHMTTNPNSSSHARLKARLAPSFAPFLGLRYEETLGVPMEMGFVVRMPHQVSTLLTVEASAGVASQSLFIPMEVEHLMQFRPWALEWAYRIEPVKNLHLFTQLEYHFYAQAPQRFMTIKRIAGRNSSLNISTPKAHELRYADVFIPRFGAKWNFHPSHKISGGLAYRPSMLRDLPSAMDNALDPSSFLFSGGWTGRFARPLPFPVKVSLSGGLEWLQKQKVIKQDQGFIGAPGYDAGGLRWFTALTLEVPLELELSTRDE